MDEKTNDRSSSSSPFQTFNEPNHQYQHHHHHHDHQLSEASEALDIVHPWPTFYPITATTMTTNFTNPIHDQMLAAILPPSPLLPFADFDVPRPHIAYGYQGLLPSAGVQGAIYRASTSALPFGSLRSEFNKMTAKEIMDAKALAASKNHSEAERRRRERINGHLAKLRSLLPNTTKTDKASLLAEVIEHVKELKRQTSKIAEESIVPTEKDELTVDVVDDKEGSFVVKASICCDDKSDLIPELIKALKAMRLRALKAEIVTLGGRVSNVLLITGQNDEERQPVEFIYESLKAILEKASASDEPSTSNSGGTKRQRMSSLTSILENRSI